MKKGIAKLLISIFAVLLTVMPFSFHVSADEFFTYTIPLEQVGVFTYFYQHGLSLPRVVTSVDSYLGGTMQCTDANTSNANCIVWTDTSANLINSAYYTTLQGWYTLNSADGFNDSESIMIDADRGTYSFVFGINRSYSGTATTWPDVSVRQYSGSAVTWSKPRFFRSGSWQIDIYEFEIPSGIGYFSFDLTAYQPVEVLPIYLGYKNQMSDDTYSFVYGDRPITVYDSSMYSLIQEGDSGSQSSVTSSDTQNTELNTSIDSLTSTEDTFLTDMDNSLNDISWSSDLLGDSSLALSANWVKTQYENMTQGNVLGDIIQYALLFGLGLLIIGKMR